MSVTPAEISAWRERHRSCEAARPPMGLLEARFVLSAHSGHGGTCQQWLSALTSLSEVTG